MIIHLTAAFLVGFSLFSPIVQVQDTATKIDNYLSEWHRTHQFNGYALVAQNGNVIFEKGYGPAVLEWGIENGPDTKFDIGSISKQFTALLIYQLVEEGKVDLNETLTTYLPDYRSDTGTKITLLQLLRHTSGIKGFLRDAASKHGAERPFPLYRPFRRIDLLRQHLSGDLLFEPDSQFRYSNTGYLLLLEVIERVTGKSFQENLQERILDPIDLHDTGLLHPSRAVDNLARGYMRIPTGMIPARYYYQPNLYGTGGMYSTARDLLKWNLALENSDVVPQSFRDAMFIPYSDGGYVKHAVSLDHFMLRLSRDEEPVSFTSFNGAIDGFISDVVRFPDDGYIVVILDNSETYNHWRIVPGIYNILKGADPRQVMAQAANELGSLALEQGVDAAYTHYQGMTEEQRAGYDYSSLESDINSFGYHYLYAGRYKEAFDLFTLNTKLFSASANVYDSLGDAYYETGDEARADELYNLSTHLRNQRDGILNALQSNEIERAEELLRSLREKFPQGELIPSSRIGPLFDQAFRADCLEEALAICRFWTLANPESVGPYFSMARIYIKSGELEKARDCYQRIIDMTPNSPSAQAARDSMRNLQ